MGRLKDYGSLRLLDGAGPVPRPKAWLLAALVACCLACGGAAKNTAVAGSLTISPVSAAYPATGGVGTIAVTANPGNYSWSYASAVSWIQNVSFSRRACAGSGTLRYIVAQNTASTARTGTIQVDAQVFTITQPAGSPQISAMDWERLAPAAAPSARITMDMAGVMNGTSYLFGGCAAPTAFSDTWSWNGTDWLRLTPAHNPGALFGHAMAYDAARNQIVLFGGETTSSSFSGETWVWDGSDWTQLKPVTSPPARAGHVMAYNPVTQRTVLFGGRSILSSEANDTWEWDGTTWSEKTGAAVPPARDSAAMTFDAGNGVILLFGGVTGLYTTPGPVCFNDTWTWDGPSWLQKTPASAPCPRAGARMAYDPDLGRVVLIGGCYYFMDAGTTPPSSVADYREETWTWNGVVWTQQFPDQSLDFSTTYGLVYDPVHKAFYAQLGDDLHCNDRGPKTYVLTPGPAMLR